jgi:hypothetical protein
VRQTPLPDRQHSAGHGEAHEHGTESQGRGGDPTSRLGSEQGESDPERSEPATAPKQASPAAADHPLNEGRRRWAEEAYVHGVRALSRVKHASGLPETQWPSASATAVVVD